MTPVAVTVAHTESLRLGEDIFSSRSDGLYRSTQRLAGRALVGYFHRIGATIAYLCGTRPPAMLVGAASHRRRRSLPTGGDARRKETADNIPHSVVCGPHRHLGTPGPSVGPCPPVPPPSLPVSHDIGSWAQSWAMCRANVSLQRQGYATPGEERRRLRLGVPQRVGNGPTRGDRLCNLLGCQASACVLHWRD